MDATVPVWVRGGACDAFLRALRDGAVVADTLEAREMCCPMCADVGDVASSQSGIFENCETPATTFTSPARS